MSISTRSEDELAQVPRRADGVLAQPILLQAQPILASVGRWAPSTLVSSQVPPSTLACSQIPASVGRRPCGCTPAVREPTVDARQRGGGGFANTPLGR